MATNEISSLTLSAAARAAIAAVAAAGDGFVIVGPADFPPDTPVSLANRCDSATRITSGSAGDRVCVLYNFRRLDRGSVDEQPLGVFITDGQVAVTGSFVQHGDWLGRTTTVSTAFAARISGSGIGGYYLAHPPAGVSSGSLDQLVGSDLRAFETFIATIASASAIHDA
jgi:hypothetical protein